MYVQLYYKPSIIVNFWLDAFGIYSLSNIFMSLFPKTSYQDLGSRVNYEVVGQTSTGLLPGTTYMFACTVCVDTIL